MLVLSASGDRMSTTATTDAATAQPPASLRRLALPLPFKCGVLMPPQDLMRYETFVENERFWVEQWADDDKVDEVVENEWWQYVCRCKSDMAIPTATNGVTDFAGGEITFMVNNPPLDALLQRLPPRRTCAA